MNERPPNPRPSTAARVGAAWRSRRRFDALADALGIGGAAALCYGLGRIYLPAGIITAGVALIIAAIGLARSTPQNESEATNGR